MVVSEENAAFLFFYFLPANSFPADHFNCSRLDFWIAKRVCDLL
jgi:hypothetical protein